MKITKENISNLLGKTIRWSAPASEGNFPYGGLARITAVNADERNPLQAEIELGDNINNAFMESGALCLSDAGREVDAAEFDGHTKEEDAIRAQGEIFADFYDDEPIIIKSQSFETCGDQFTMHWFICRFAASVAIELGGEFFVTDDWQGYCPMAPDGIENCRWLHDGHPCIIINGLPRIFPA